MSATVKIADRLGQLSGDPERRDIVRRCFFMVTGGDADWDDAKREPLPYRLLALEVADKIRAFRDTRYPRRSGDEIERLAERVCAALARSRRVLKT
jgi:hypothetical protein